MNNLVFAIDLGNNHFSVFWVFVLNCIFHDPIFVIIGYPGETEKDFENTIDLIKEVGFINSYSFIFSPRPGTPAATKKVNNKSENLEKLKKLQSVLETIQINNNKENLIFENDEHPRNNLIIDDLKKLKTVFKENGTVTPGNSSGINDGAAATVLMTRKQAELKSIEPLVKVVSWASCGVEPSLMGLGPIPSVKEALNKADWNINDVDLFEINEAFAAQSIAVIKELKIPAEKVNVNGGAIALGHPIGASGTRILVTLIHEMIKQNKSKGCAALCIGGGMGIAMCVERN